MQSKLTDKWEESSYLHFLVTSNFIYHIEKPSSQSDNIIEATIFSAVGGKYISFTSVAKKLFLSTENEIGAAKRWCEKYTPDAELAKKLDIARQQRASGRHVNVTWETQHHGRSDSLQNYKSRIANNDGNTPEDRI